MRVRRREKKKDLRREAEIAAFWRFSSHQMLLQDSKRLHQIKIGLPVYLIQSLRHAFET